MGALNPTMEKATTSNGALTSRDTYDIKLKGTYKNNAIAPVPSTLLRNLSSYGFTIKHLQIDRKRGTNKFHVEMDLSIDLKAALTHRYNDYSVSNNIGLDVKTLSKSVPINIELTIRDMTPNELATDYLGNKIVDAIIHDNHRIEIIRIDKDTIITTRLEKN